MFSRHSLAFAIGGGFPPFFFLLCFVFSFKTKFKSDAFSIQAVGCLTVPHPQPTCLDLKYVRFPPDVSCFWGLWLWAWGFWIFVIPGKWQLHGHKWTATVIYELLLWYPWIWQSLCGGVCGDSSTIQEGLLCDSSAVTCKQLWTSWGAGTPCGSELLTWVPEAGSMAPEGTEGNAQEDTGIKPGILSRLLLVTKGMHLRSRQNSFECNILSFWCPFGSSSHSWMGAGWCTRLGCNKSWMYFGRAGHWKVNLLNLKAEVKKGGLISEGWESQK